MVLVVLGLAAGLVLARGPQRSAAVEMRGAAAAVAQAMRLARTQAIVTNRRVDVAVDPRAGTVRIGAAAARSLPSGIAVSAVVTTADTAAAAAAPSIAFLPDGSSTGGRVELLGAGQRRTAVGVDWLTGRVLIADGP